jgi:hypothetical protein
MNKKPFCEYFLPKINTFNVITFVKTDMKRLFFLLSLFFVVSLISCRQIPSEWMDLLNGKDLENWKTVLRPENFKIQDGNLVCSGETGFLLAESAGKFKNFELVAEIKTSADAFSAVLFHTSENHSDVSPAGYQVVIHNAPPLMTAKEKAMKTGSLLGVRNLYFPMVNDGEWFTLSVKVVENQIETFINGIRVIKYVQPGEPWRNNNQEKKILSEGFVGIETMSGETSFKSLKIRALPKGKKGDVPVNNDWDTRVTRLMDQYFPLIDFHVHLKGGLTIDQAIENSQKLGINYGIAPNCGLKFPVTNDITLAAYMDTVRGKPIFRGMQAEGREWITLFSPEAVAKFDYVFTDALTFTDEKGRRNRLWMPQEVWVDDKQQFMDMLVSKIEAIFSQEPVNIYVNPTLLPASIMPEYDQLWTPERITRVIKVLKDNNITLEINARYKVPHVSIIREAKKAGLKFSFGTNNAAADLGQLEYCLQMIEECGLTPEDMFLPPVHENKPVLVKGLPIKITG